MSSPAQYNYSTNDTVPPSENNDTATLTPPPRPIAIRPEYITTAETTLIVTNSAESWHSLDYSVDLDGMTIFTVCGQPWSLGQRKIFHDRSGLPLFELGCPWYNSSTMTLALPGSTGRELLHAKLRVSVQAPNVVATFENAVGYKGATPTRAKSEKVTTTSTTTAVGGIAKRLGSVRGKDKAKRGGDVPHVPDYVKIEVHRLDLDNLVQVVVVENCRVAYIRRITNREELTQGQRPPFRFRPRWRVILASGMDVSLISVLVVIVARRIGGDLNDHHGQMV